MKKIALSLFSVGLLAAIIGGGTIAFLSDTEVSTGNTFAAGAIDLKIDNTQHYNGNECVATENGYVWQGPSAYPVPGTPCTGSWAIKDLTGEKFFDFKDLKPGDQGENTISFHVYNNDAWLCGEMGNFVSTDGPVQAEPELLIDPTLDGEGELDDNLYFYAWNDDGDNKYEPNGGEEGFSPLPVKAADLADLKWPIADSSTGDPVIGSEDGATRFIAVAWCYGAMDVNGGNFLCEGDNVDNSSQTDTFTADFKFTAEQARNNGDFLCNPPETGQVTVIKEVVNGDGGTATVEDFALFVGTIQMINGQAKDIPAGTYNVNETGPAGYAASFSGNCDQAGKLDVAAGGDYTCTITNDDSPTTLTLVKTVKIDNGGTKSVADFTLMIDGNAVGSGVASAVAPGAHTASEDSLPGYSASAWGGDCAADGSITLALGDKKTCTITNDDLPGKLIVKKTVVGGGLSASDFSFSLDGGTPAAFEADGENELTLDAGIYTVTEPAVAGYVTDYDNCNSVDIQNGETENCTVTNRFEDIITCNADLDLMLVLDRSGSIDGTELTTLKTAAHSFVGTLAPTADGVHVGQSSFASAGTLDRTLTDDEAAAHAAINALVAGGQTDLEAGLTLAKSELDDANPRERPATHDVIVVITDGEPNVPAAPAGQARTDAANAAAAARAAGIEVFAVGVGVSAATETFLKDSIADDADHYFSADQYTGLEDILLALVACEETSRVYGFTGVTTANDGTGNFPLSLEHESDVWPWTVPAHQISAISPSDAEYLAIAADDNARWTTGDPGNTDVMAVRFAFLLAEPAAKIQDLKFLWKGRPSDPANIMVYALKSGQDEFTPANWTQLGGSLALPKTPDTYLVRHIAGVDAPTYVGGADNRIDLLVVIDNDSEDIQTDYAELLVRAEP